MNPSKFEALPANREELEIRWPGLLSDMLTTWRSTADPAEVASGLRRDPRFMALVQGWDDMPSASQANAWVMIQERLWEAARLTRTDCRRCGDCCAAGSPVIYAQDLPMLAREAVRRKDLMTLRKGERAWSNRRQKLVTLEMEQVKIREAAGGRACVFLASGRDACLVYEDRPHQCRIMECWDPSRFDTLSNLTPLSRLDLLGRDNPLSRLIESQEERAPAGLVADILAQEGDLSAGEIEKALDPILFDLHLREFAREKLGLADDEMDFFFGRPLAALCPSLGWVLREDDSGKPVLVRVEAS